MLRRGEHRQAAHPRSGEAGYTLIELMVVAALLAVVLGAILTLAEATQRIAPRETERAHVIREAQVGLHRMTRELRHAYAAPPTVPAPTVTGSTVQANVLGRGGATRTVRYDCDEAHPTDSGYTRCLRQVLSGGTWSPAEVVIDRVLNGTTVFTLTPPDYVRAAVEVAARGDRKTGYTHRVILDDGFYMRNLDG
jgi:prepilin-type N-terminal cleavage/methylation domain-containing protein